VRLVIGGPTLAMVPASFAEHLAKLYAFTREHGPWESVSLWFKTATYVHVGREAVLRTAIETFMATHILWLDTDMEFPADTAIRLGAHGQSIVACNAVMKTPDRHFTAWKMGARVVSDATTTGLESVDTVGMAVMLMRVDVVDGLTHPWFRHGLNEAGEDVGEDVRFCRLLRARGHEIYIDHDLSKEIGHIGQYTFRPDCAASLAV
jgi:hypothetical protein